MDSSQTAAGLVPFSGSSKFPRCSLDPNTGQYAPRAALTLCTRPDSESKILAQISSPEAIDTAEYGYEEKGALVYGRQRGYFLIRTSRGVGWLSRHSAGSFHPFETLIKSDLTYLTEAWDGFVSASPGRAVRTRVPQRRPYGSEAVRVKALQTVYGRRCGLKLKLSATPTVNLTSLRQSRLVAGSERTMGLVRRRFGSRPAVVSGTVGEPSLSTHCGARSCATSIPVSVTAGEFRSGTIGTSA